MAWYNWLALAIFAVSATTCYLLAGYDDGEASPGVRAGREVARIIAGACVVMFIFQGLELLQA